MKKIRRKALRAAEPATPYGEASVMIADLKAHLSEYLRTVRAGRAFTILDRKTPIARVVPVNDPHHGLTVRPATRTWADVAPRLARLKPVKLTIDPVDLVREMRKDKI